MPTRIEEIAESRQKERQGSPEVIQCKALANIADDMTALREQVELLTRAVTEYLARKG